jgi:3D (Asp-Asp-Asp) domain-containing protein
MKRIVYMVGIVIVFITLYTFHINETVRNQDRPVIQHDIPEELPTIQEEKPKEEEVAETVEVGAHQVSEAQPLPNIEKVEQELASRGNDRKNYKEYVMEVTAYDLSYASCGKYPDHPAYAVTASGKKIGTDIFEEEGIIAAPKNFPFGTKIEIEGWGTGTVWDRGGAIKYYEETGMYRLDIFIADSQKAKEWGKRILKVKVFDEGEKPNE